MPFPSLPAGWITVLGSVFCDRHQFVLVDENGQTYQVIPQSNRFGGYLRTPQKEKAS